jgi:hypothetical protein
MTSDRAHTLRQGRCSVVRYVHREVFDGHATRPHHFDATPITPAHDHRLHAHTATIYHESIYVSRSVEKEEAVAR